MREKLPWPARLSLGAAYLLAMGLLTAGTVLLWDYFVIEHGRGEPWKASLGLSSDLSAFLWFQSFFWRHAVRGRSFKPVPWAEFIRKRGPLYLLGGTVLAMGVDAFMTYELSVDDRERFEKRAVTRGTVDRVDEGTSQYRKKWELIGTFEVGGVRYPFRFRADGSVVRNALRMDQGIPPEVGRGIESKAVPFEIPVAYDPGWPARNWLEGPEWNDVNRGWYIGYMFLCAQLIGVVFTLVVIKDGYDRGELRSWWECFWIVPLIFQALIVFGLGMDYRQQGVMNLS